MEESLKDALLQAGEHLAEAMRAGLSAQGLPNDLCVIVEDGRVVVASRSAALRKAELGSAGVAPRAAMEGAARAASAHAVRVLTQHLEGFRDVIEAFEIGVSLALQDGVSDAIGKARRDVAALEDAVRTSGVSVQSLRDAGTKVSSVSFGDRHGAAVEEPLKRVVQETEPRTVKEVPPAPSGTLLGISQAEQPDLGALDALSPMPMPIAPEAETAAPQPPVAAPEALVPASSQPVGVTQYFVGATTAGAQEGAQQGLGQASALLAAVARAERPEGPGAASVGVVAPVILTGQERAAAWQPSLDSVALPAQTSAPLLREEDETNEGSPPVSLAASPDRDLRKSGGSVSLLNALQFSGGSVSVPQDDDQYVAQAVDTPDASDGGRDDDAQHAPVLTAKAYGAAPSRGVAAAGSPAENGPQRAEPGASGPLEGDVFLDGMLVGALDVAFFESRG